MKYYDNAYDRIIEASLRAPADQCLFLVPDIYNTHDSNAIMLHDGRRKLGHVARGEAAFIKRFLEKEAAAEGNDQVLVVSVSSILDKSFMWTSSFTVRIAGIVHERIARKHARKLLKEN